MKKEEYILEKELRTLSESSYPFHMPGHKRMLSPGPGLPFSFDLTEVEGADDLHDAHGILKEAMERTAELFGADRTWYLVGGSTVGNLAMIRAAAPFGSTVIAGRNCHKSVYHAIELGHLRVRWVLPEADSSFEVFGSVTPQAVEAALEKEKDCRAVIITSPTYEGAVSDIAGIAKVCHDRDVPLLVDEAHGAHLGLFPEAGFPDSSIHLGADLCVQSAHKTLPSLTQTAFLHQKGDRIDPREVEQQLNIFETSSPSYPLMASLDGCTGILREEGSELFASWRKRLDAFSRALQGKSVSCVKVLCKGDDDRNNHPAFFDFDDSKILIRSQRSGDTMARFLREYLHLESEMHCGRNVLCMTSCADTDQGMESLLESLLEADREEKMEESQEAIPLPRIPAPGDAEMSIGEAVTHKGMYIPKEEAEGRICLEYVYPYPPGIPVLVPGEKITGEMLELVRRFEESGAKIIHTKGTGGTVYVSK